MKKIILIIISLVFFIPKVFAVTLSEALTQAYKNNPELNAERENIKVSEEDLNISKGDYLPTLTLSGSKSKENTNTLTNQSGGDASITDVDPLSVTCYRQGEKFKKYDPNIKPLPKSIVWSWVANSSIRYGVVDEQSRNHGLWIEFLNNEPTSAELWNHGFQVGLARRDSAGQWSTRVKGAEFEMPSDPVAVWHEINQDYFNPDYAKTLIEVKHSMIRHDLALAKLVSPSVLSNIESDKIRFAQKGN